MNVFFDVDDTIVSSYTGALRPFVRDVFAALRADGHAIYVWSGMGIRWSTLDRHGLRDYITDCLEKPFGRGIRASSRRAVAPDFVVDDEAEFVGHFRGLVVAPFLDDQSDREMMRVLEAVRAGVTGPS